MEVVQVLHMNKGEEEISYAKNSSIQNKILLKAKPVIKEAIQEFCFSSAPRSIAIADLGCSSGPNTLLLISEVINTVYATSRQMNHSPPEFRVFLNDLYTNDFNDIFCSLPAFYDKLRQEKGAGVLGPHCFVSATPGSFYGRLFPCRNLHIVHSSSSLHWLSQIPLDLKSEVGRNLNRGKICISRNSPPKVVEAYRKQFQDDFSCFLKSRSEEMVAGGRMVLSLMGRESMDFTDKSYYQWELLAEALMSMVSEGLIEEDKVDCFNAPYYAPCVEELELEVEKEKSFTINKFKTFEVGWDEGSESTDDDMLNHGGNSFNPPVSSGERVAKTVRAVVESMFEAHFGHQILDDLFRRFAILVSQRLVKKRLRHVNLVVSLTRRPMGNDHSFLVDCPFSF